MTNQLSSNMYGQARSQSLAFDTAYPAIPDGLEERKIRVDTAHPLDRSFEEYGHHFYRVSVLDGHGRWTDNSGIKFWEQNGQYRKMLPLSVPVYPFEPMEVDIEATLNGVLKESKFKIVQQNGEKIRFSHNGFTAYWTLLSEDYSKKVRNSYVLDDVVQIGLILRNGINTGVALGADFFTHRLWCMNGAVGRGHNFGSISIRHVGDQKRMIETFRQGIPIVVKLGERIIDYYEKACGIKMTDKAAQHIYAKTRIANKYLPNYFHIDEDQKELEKKVTLTSEGRNITLYELFNDLTEPLTKSLNSHDYTENNKKIIHLGFSGFSNKTRALHQALINICDNRVNKVEVA